MNVCNQFCSPPFSEIEFVIARIGQPFEVFVFQVCWLDLDYLHLAGAALHCSAAFTALLYVEFWCKENHGRLTLGEQDVLSEVCYLHTESHIIACSQMEATLYEIRRQPM